MFADDTKLYHTITSESECNILQLDLNNVMNWENMWLTNFTNVSLAFLYSSQYREYIFFVMYW